MMIKRSERSAGVAAVVRIQATGVTRFVSLDDPAADDTADRIEPERQAAGRLSLMVYGFGDDVYEVEFLVADDERLVGTEIRQWVADAAEVPVEQVRIPAVRRDSGSGLAR